MWGYKTTRNMPKDIMCGKRQCRKRTRNDDDDDNESSTDLPQNKGMKSLFNLFGNKETEVSDNSIYFTDDITQETMDSLNKKIRETSKRLRKMAIEYDMPAPLPIKLHINSGGGSIIAAFSCIDCIRTCGVEVHTYVEGIAASAATLISVFGTRRFIGRTSYMLIHELRSCMWGKMSEMEDEMVNLKELMDKIKTIYVEHTNLSTRDLNKILSKDIYWNAETCLEHGLVDEII